MISNINILDKLNKHITNHLENGWKKEWQKEWQNYYITNLINITDNTLDWYCISANPNIDYQFYLDNPDYPWVWGGICANPNITMDFIKLHMNIAWDISGISQNPSITMEDIENNTLIDWDWEGISKNPNVTQEFYYQHQDENWVWTDLIKNINLTIPFIEENKHMFDLDLITQNPSLTNEIFEYYKGGYTFWNWYCISAHPNIVTVEKAINPGSDWCWMGVSANPNITMKVIEDNPKKYWKMYGLCHNPNVSFDYILSYKEIMLKKGYLELNYVALSLNTFEKERLSFITKKVNSKMDEIKQFLLS